MSNFTYAQPKVNNKNLLNFSNLHMFDRCKLCFHNNKVYRRFFVYKLYISVTKTKKKTG